MEQNTVLHTTSTQHMQGKDTEFDRKLKKRIQELEEANHILERDKNNYIERYVLINKLLVWYYTHRQKLSNSTFFRRQSFGTCRTEYAGNGNQIFWILLKILLLWWAHRAKYDLVTKYLDNSRPFTKQLKIKQKNNEKVCSRCLKNHFHLDF